MTIELSQPRERRRGQDNILPLINIVFLLLIFFLMAGTLSNSPEVSLQPPATQEAENDKLPHRALYVTKDGLFFSKSKEVTHSLLDVILTEMKASLDKRPFYIIADKESNATQIIEIAKLAKKIGIEKVKLLTLKERQ